MFRFVGKKQASESLSMGSTSLRKYRVEGDWIEGIHWIKFNSRCIRYNVDLLQDWVNNRQDPAAHQLAIARYQATLLSNQPKSKRYRQS